MLGSTRARPSLAPIPGSTATTAPRPVRCWHVRRFESRVAVEIAKAGLRTGDSFRFLRNGLGMSEAGLAGLLDVPAEYVGYWESEKWPVDPRALAVLRGLVLAKFEDKHAALDCLAVLREPRKLSRKVRLHLNDALQN